MLHGSCTYLTTTLGRATDFAQYKTQAAAHIPKFKNEHIGTMMMTSLTSTPLGQQNSGEAYFPVSFDGLQFTSLESN